MLLPEWPTSGNVCMHTLDTETETDWDGNGLNELKRKLKLKLAGLAETDWTVHRPPHCNTTKC